MKQPYTETPFSPPADEVAAMTAERRHSGERLAAQQAAEQAAMQEAAADEAASKSATQPARKWWYLGGQMGKRILGIVIFVVVAYLLYVGYTRYASGRRLGSGDIVQDTTPQRTNTDGSYTITDEAAAKPMRTQAVVQPRPQQTYTTPVAAAPVTDSIAANPQNGMTFAGTGKFQVYRQGNLTWRVDTESGHTCILFATDEEWRKPIVYTHGCNNS